MNKNSTTILIIEDETVLRESMADYLEDRDFQIFKAENGRIGLEIFEREHPDLVLTDLRMPEVDGLEVLRRAGKLSPETPLIVVSGTGRIGDSIQALRLGAWDYILKPIEDMSIISIAVEKSLERSRLLQENRTYQENLETLVQERTAELKEANDRLADINDRLRKIVETTQGLNACIDLKHFGERVLEEFALHMKAAGGSLYFAEDDGLRQAHTLDPGHSPEFLPFPLTEHSVLKKVMDSGTPLVLEDLANSEDLKPSGWDGYQDGSFLAFPIPDESQKTVGIITLHSKIRSPFTEQDKEIGAVLASYSCETLRAVRATETLRENEAKYRHLIEYSGDAIYLLHNRRFEIINSKFTELFGITIEKINAPDFDFMNLVAPESRPFIEERIRLQAEGRKVDPKYEFKALHADGHEMLVEASITYIKYKDGIASQGIIRDISEKRKLEEQLQQAQKMEAIGTLAGGIAHDFNNILTVINGYSDIILLKLTNDDAITADIKAIRSAGDRAEKLTRQILAFSRKQIYKPQIIDINKVIDDLDKMLYRLIGEDISIEKQFAPNLPGMKADPGQIEQILINLFVNARDAINQKTEKASEKKITIETGQIFLDKEYTDKHIGSQAGLHVIFCVGDSGIGMTKEVEQKIFDPFFTLKEKDKGTGLGLATVYGIVKQNNGNIFVSSEPGIGTKFKIYWPASSENLVENHITESTGKDLSGSETILFVEDVEEVCAFADNALSGLGYKVNIAHNGLEALELIKEKKLHIDLLITDLIMPDMNGKELSAEIKKVIPNVRVLFASGYTENHIVTGGELDREINFLQKPYSVSDLALKVREILDK